MFVLASFFVSFAELTFNLLVMARQAWTVKQFYFCRLHKPQLCRWTKFRVLLCKFLVSLTHLFPTHLFSSPWKMFSGVRERHIGNKWVNLKKFFVAARLSLEPQNLRWVFILDSIVQQIFTCLKSNTYISISLIYSAVFDLL